MNNVIDRALLARLSVEFAVTRLLVVLAGVAALAFIPSVTGPEYHHISTNPLVDMWSRWDAAYYLDIAFGVNGSQAGLAGGNSAFFPILPALINSGLGFIPHASRAAGVAIGVLISNLALLAATIFLQALVRLDFGPVVAWNVRWLIWLSPVSIFFSGIYTESLFLLFSVLAVYCARRQQWLAAGLAGFIAGLTRPVGFVLVIPLLWLAWQQDQFLKRLPAAIGPALGYGVYIGLVGLANGEPLAYFSINRSIWSISLSAPWQAFTHYFAGPPTLFGWERSLVNLAFTVGYFALAMGVFRSSKANGWYSLALLVVPLVTGVLVGMPRYGAVAFPLYSVLAGWMGENRRRQLLVLGGSFALSLVFTARFVTWRWVA